MQKDLLLKAIKEQAEKVYETWQSTAYRKTQQLSSVKGGSKKDFVRYTIKGAHFLELTQKWYAKCASCCLLSLRLAFEGLHWGFIKSCLATRMATGMQQLFLNKERAGHDMTECMSVGQQPG
jgi:hypothetical protein